MYPDNKLAEQTQNQPPISLRALCYSLVVIALCFTSVTSAQELIVIDQKNLESHRSVVLDVLSKQVGSLNNTTIDALLIPSRQEQFKLDRQFDVDALLTLVATVPQVSNESELELSTISAHYTKIVLFTAGNPLIRGEFDGGFVIHTVGSNRQKNFRESVMSSYPKAIVFTHTGEEQSLSSSSVRISEIPMFEPDSGDNKLDAVVITKKRWKERQTNEQKRNNDYLKMGIMLEGTGANIITSDEIGQYVYNMGDVIRRAQFPGLSKRGGKLVVRGYSSIKQDNSILFMIDGIPTDSFTFMTFDPQQMDRLILLKSLADTAIYGPGAQNGVLMIISKTMAGSVGKERATDEVRRYTEDLAATDELEAAAISDLATGTPRQVFNDHLARRGQGAQPSSGQAALASWLYRNGGASAARAVVHDLGASPHGDHREAGLHAALAAGDVETSLRLALDLTELSPTTPQYRILAARAYRLAGNLPLALNELAELSALDADLSMVSEPVNHELAHIEQVGLPGIPKVTDAVLGQDLRLVLWWNRPGAQFSVDVISPDRSIDTYAHDIGTNEARLRAELKHGFATDHLLSQRAPAGSYWVRITNKEQVPVSFLVEAITGHGRNDESRGLQSIVIAPGATATLEKIFVPMRAVVAGE